MLTNPSTKQLIHYFYHNVVKMKQSIHDTPMMIVTIFNVRVSKG